MSTELVLITLLKLFHIPCCLEVQHLSSILSRLLQQNSAEIDKDFYLIGKIGVNDKKQRLRTNQMKFSNKQRKS